MLSSASKRILEKGKYIWLHWYDYPNGSRYVASYKDKFYYIIDDGTGNGFFCDGSPEEITRERAIALVLKYLGVEKGIKALKEEFNIEVSEEEIDEALGL